MEPNSSLRRQSSQVPANNCDAAQKLRKRLTDPNRSILVCPGAYDVFSARIALALGFEAIYLTSPGIASRMLNETEATFAEKHGMRSHVDAIAKMSPSIASMSPETAIIADADTTYGGPVMMKRSFDLYSRSNIAALHIDDQFEAAYEGQTPHKLDLLSRDEYKSRIAGAVSAKKSLESDVVIIARTAALHRYGWEEAVARLEDARASGAEIGFLSGVTSKEQAARVPRALDFPVMLSVVHGGSTPLITAKEAEEMGFALIIFPCAALGPAYDAIRESFELLKQAGELKTEGAAPLDTIHDATGLSDTFMNLATGK